MLVSINRCRFDFSNLQYGVGQARRGWLEKDDVLKHPPARGAAAPAQAHHVKPCWPKSRLILVICMPRYRPRQTSSKHASRNKSPAALAAFVLGAWLMFNRRDS